MTLKRISTPSVSELSKRGKKSRRKGSTYENEIAHLLYRHTGVEFVRTPMSGGFVKRSDVAKDFRGDILPVDRSVQFKLHPEIKNCVKWTLKEWLKQSQEDCPEGKIPVVIMKKNNTIKEVGKKGNQQNIIALDLEDFLSIVDMDSLFRRTKG